MTSINSNPKNSGEKGKSNPSGGKSKRIKKSEPVKNSKKAEKSKKVEKSKISKQSLQQKAKNSLCESKRLDPEMRVTPYDVFSLTILNVILAILPPLQYDDSERTLVEFRIFGSLSLCFRCVLVRQEFEACISQCPLITSQSRDTSVRSVVIPF